VNPHLERRGHFAPGGRIGVARAQELLEQLLGELIQGALPVIGAHLVMLSDARSEEL
jgi:hypothetical protein